MHSRTWLPLAFRSDLRVYCLELPDSAIEEPRQVLERAINCPAPNRINVHPASRVLHPVRAVTETWIRTANRLSFLRADRQLPFELRLPSCLPSSDQRPCVRPLEARRRQQRRQSHHFDSRYGLLVQGYPTFLLSAVQPSLLLGRYREPLPDI